MAMYRDQTGYEMSLPDLPLRIVSLVPSQTELLFDLGLNDSIVGITRFCIHPAPKVKGRTLIGGTKNPDLNVIRSLKPELIIANKEENRREDIETLRKEFPVWTSDISTLQEATDMIRQIGQLVDKEASANWMAGLIEQRFNQLSEESAQSGQRVAYFIWRNPWMVAGQDTFIHTMLTQAGWRNVFAHQPRYPQCSIEDLQAQQPDLLLFSTEPYPFQEKHMEEVAATLPYAKVHLVDGALFTWYGSRLLRTPAYLQSLRQSLL